MPVTLDKFVLQLAQKAGMQPTDPKLIELLAHTELNRINVADELVSNLEGRLLSIDDAKNNHPAIKTHYFAEIMSNVDRVLDGIYRDYDFTEDEKAEFAQERSSTKRINLVIAKLKEKKDAELAAAGSKKDPNTQQHLQTINELNGQLASLKQQIQQAKDAHQNELREIKLTSNLNSRLAGIKTVLDNLPGDARTVTLRQLITKELQDNGIKILLDENGGLILQRNDGSNYFDENNRQVSVDDFISRTLAKNKVLPQTPAPGSKGERPQNGSDTDIVDGKPKNGNYSMKSLIEEAEQSLTNANPVVSAAATS